MPDFTATHPVYAKLPVLIPIRYRFTQVSRREKLAEEDKSRK
jgi:hypothetical protein